MNKHPNFQPFLAYSASAGSGKTFALSVRYVSLLFMGEMPSSILAATFTNKAAAEMRQRVVDSLRELHNNVLFLHEVMRVTGYSKKEMLSKQPEVLARFLSGSSYIVTLDSFFASVLRSASLELGLEPDFVVKIQDDSQIEEEFLEQVRSAGMLSSLVELAIDIEDKRFEKIFDYLQNFYRSDPLLPEPEHELAVLESIESRIDECREELRVLVERAGASKSAIGNFAPMTVTALFSKSVFSKRSLLEHRNYKKYIEVEPRIDELYFELKGLLAHWSKAREARVLHNFFEIYDYFKNATISSAKSLGSLSFDDLNYFTYRLLYEGISREFLYFKLDSKFKHILLDEFQDTSTLQFLLLKPMVDEIFSGLGQSEFKSFFYVGDTKQSLYRFRGGVEELFDKVANEYGVEIMPMDTNYRSTKNLVEQVNRWFEPAMYGYVAQKSRIDAKDGYVEVVQSDELLDEALVQVKRLLDFGISIDDIAFLVSTNKDGQSLQEVCEQNSIPTQLMTSSSLKFVPKVASLVSMVEYLYFGAPIDAMAMMELIGDDIELDSGWFSPTMTPLVVIDRLVREYGYFDNDANVLKLLEFASSFSDVSVFLDEFKQSDIPVASKSIHGAKIMTVHGSKGLEFEYVILLDKMTRPNSDRSALIYEYSDELAIRRIFYRMSGRENFDDDYETARQNQRVLSEKDHLNVLYVAMTRAVNGMIVVRKEKSSWFDALGVSVMKLGRLEKDDTKKASCEEGESREVTLSHYGLQDSKVVHEEGEIDFDAVLFGTAMHYALEMLESFDKESIDGAMISVQNRYAHVLSQKALAQICQRVNALVQDETFAQLVLGAKVTKEQSVSFDGELKQIDLLLEFDDYCVVVDYKSSQKFAYKHKEQVGYYKKAIEKITGKKTQAVIVYLGEERISNNTIEIMKLA